MTKGFERGDDLDDAGNKVISFFTTNQHPWLSAVEIDTAENKVIISLKDPLFGGYFEVDPEVSRKHQENLQGLQVIFGQNFEELGSDIKPNLSPSQAELAKRVEGSEELLATEFEFAAGPNSKIRSVLAQAKLPKDMELAIMDELQAQWRAQSK